MMNIEKPRVAAIGLHDTQEDQIRSLSHYPMFHKRTGGVGHPRTAPLPGTQDLGTVPLQMVLPPINRGMMNPHHPTRQTHIPQLTGKGTVWISVWDADEEAGCLHLVPRSHIRGLYQHCPGGKATSPSGLDKLKDL